MISRTEFITQRWIPALRSGEYKQGFYRLRNEDGCFCCLGVACDLLIKEGLLAPWLEDESGYSVSAEKDVDALSLAFGNYEGALHNKDSEFLPQRVAKYLNMPPAGFVIPAEECEIDLERYPNIAHKTNVTLSEANDFDVSFYIIATLLEKHCSDSSLVNEKKQTLSASELEDMLNKSIVMQGM